VWEAGPFDEVRGTDTTFLVSGAKIVATPEGVADYVKPIAPRLTASNESPVSFIKSCSSKVGGSEVVPEVLGSSGLRSLSGFCRSASLVISNLL
jgi:hypothetical protein